MVMFLHHLNQSHLGLLLRREDEVPLTKEDARLICLTLQLEGQPLARGRCHAKGQQPGLRPQVLPLSQSTYAVSTKSTERSVSSTSLDPAATRTARSSSATITCTRANIALRALYALSTQVVKLMIVLETCLDLMMLSNGHFRRAMTCDMQRDRRLLPEPSLKFDVQGKRRGGK